MSQPFDARAEAPALRDLDTEHGEFWVPSPWLFPSSGENLSAYEANGVHLNAGDGSFFDISFLSGADSTGDGRSVLSFDITRDGMPELFVRQAGGGALIVYENLFPDTSWLRVSLRGVESNRLGVGSRVSCSIGDKTIHRELFPNISFHSQGPAVVSFGLEDAERVDRLTIVWPSGRRQIVTEVATNQHILVTEGQESCQRLPLSQESQP